MFLVVIAVLSLILAFPEPPYSLVHDVGRVIAVATAATVVPPAVALLVTRRVRGRLDEHPGEPGIGQQTFARGLSSIHALLALGQGALLCLTDWLTLCARTPVVGRWLALPGLLSTLPFLISTLLAWIALYPADRSIRQIALELQILRGRPVRPVWPLGRYLLFNLRHQVLFILIPMLLLLATRDAIYVYEQPLRQLALRMVRGPQPGRDAARLLNGFELLPDLLLGAAAVLVALIAPLILRYVWVTRALPDGPLRDRLVSLCRRLRMRCRDILVWHSGGMLVNAAVMGVIPRLRYVMITDAMIEQLDDTKIEAVFGHEAGHVKRHHIACFLLFAFISGCVITIMRTRLAGQSELTVQLVSAVVGAGLCFKWVVLFGWISRRFERQADLFGVRTLAAAGVPCQVECALHSADNPGQGLDPLRTARPLCRTAAHIFGDTLNDVARLNGMAPEARSWRHGSIASRSRILQRYALDPQAALRFERSVRRMKLAIVLTALALGLWAAWEMNLWALARAILAAAV